MIPATALFDGGHTECTGCHKPHDFDSKKALGCASCHTQVSLLGGGKIAAHNGCTNCHSPHNVRGTPSGACANCHKNVSPTHPAKGGPGGCVGCHDPHPNVAAGTGGIHAASGANDCTSCHKMADSEHAFHKGVACESCHKPHDFKIALGNLTLCGACHANRVTQVAANAAHKACTQCHQGLPHKPEAQQVGCATCHGRVDQMDIVRMEAPLGMGWCLDCHRDPKPNLRPKDQITNMEWTPAASPGFAPPDVNPPQHCSGCHR